MIISSLRFLFISGMALIAISMGGISNHGDACDERSFSEFLKSLATPSQLETLEARFLEYYRTVSEMPFRMVADPGDAYRDLDVLDETVGFLQESVRYHLLEALKDNEFSHWDMIRFSHEWLPNAAAFWDLEGKNLAMFHETLTDILRRSFVEEQDWKTDSAAKSTYVDYFMYYFSQMIDCDENHERAKAYIAYYFVPQMAFSFYLDMRLEPLSQKDQAHVRTFLRQNLQTFPKSRSFDGGYYGGEQGTPHILVDLPEAFHGSALDYVLRVHETEHLLQKMAIPSEVVIKYLIGHEDKKGGLDLERFMRILLYTFACEQRAIYAEWVYVNFIASFPDTLSYLSVQTMLSIKRESSGLASLSPKSSRMEWDDEQIKFLNRLLFNSRLDFDHYYQREKMAGRKSVKQTMEFLMEGVFDQKNIEKTAEYETNLATMRGLFKPVTDQQESEIYDLVERSVFLSYEEKEYDVPDLLEVLVTKKE